MTDLDLLNNRLSKINKLFTFINKTLNLDDNPISVDPITDTLFNISLDGIPDLIQTLDTSNPNDIIFNSDTYITHYTSIDSFILSYIDFITDTYIPDNS